MRPATGAARVSKRTVRLRMRVLSSAPWSGCSRTRLRSPALRPAFHPGTAKRYAQGPSSTTRTLVPPGEGG
jgi:hypothetical protein